MIIKPKRRGFICTTAHPKGCAAHVQEQIDFVKNHPSIENGPKKALVIGASTGYGLASRVAAAFGSQAATIGVIFERPAEGKRTATAGWYNTAAFEEKARAKGLYAKTVNGDAFSDEVKQKVIEMIKNDLGEVDLIVYSLASPRRQHPKTGEVAKSTLKPIGRSFTSKTLDLEKSALTTISLEEASEEDVRQTVSVMGGEDWEMWIDALEKEGCLADGATTVAYSYVGPEITRIVYRHGTIGKAKEHLEQTARELNGKLKKKNGHAYISANKALITQSSSAIPVIPLYFVLLSKIMKEKNIEEDCIMQIYRLFNTALYMKEGPDLDENGLIRMDDYEIRDDVQKEVMEKWKQLSDETLPKFADLEGFNTGFLKLFGFGLDGVDYDEDVDPDKPIPSLV